MYIVFANFFLIGGSSAKKIVQLETDYRTSQDEVAVLKSELEELKITEKFRSKQTTTCIERGIDRESGGVGFLFAVKIMDISFYEIEGKQYTFKQILQIYQNDIAIAERNGCVHSINVKYEEGMDARVFNIAHARLKTKFYTMVIN